MVSNNTYIKTFILSLTRLKLWEFVWLHVVTASLLAFAFLVHFVKWPVYWPLWVKGLKLIQNENTAFRTKEMYEYCNLH